MSASFEREYVRFMERQLAESSGERLRRLAEERRHAEKLFLRHVWWPLFGNFDGLHAEWEVPDLRRGFRYLDFAYVLPPLWIAIEVEGFGVHARDADRRKFEDDHLRAAYLTAEGWKVMRFSYDTVNERPERIRHLLTLLIGKWSGAGRSSEAFTDAEKEIIRLAIRRQGPLTPADVCAVRGVSDRTARRQLQRLVEKGAFRPFSGSIRVRSYELCDEKLERFLGM